MLHSERVWTGPDGQEYRWALGRTKPELYRNDPQQTLVAKFHREHSGFMGIHGQTQASLEIFGKVSEELTEMVLVTFVYVDAVREANHLATRNRHGITTG